MKSFFLSILLIAVASFLLELFLPWWIIAVVAFAVTYFIKQNSFAAFLSGFVAVFLSWLVYAYILSGVNDNLLASKVAALLPLHGNVNLLFLVTGLIGGLVSGFGALTGSLAGKISS